MCETPILSIKVIYFSRILLAFLFTFPVETLHFKPCLFYQVFPLCNSFKANLFKALSNSINFKINLCPRINLIDPGSNQISNHLEDQRLFTKTQGKHMHTMAMFLRQQVGETLGMFVCIVLSFFMHFCLVFSHAICLIFVFAYKP